MTPVRKCYKMWCMQSIRLAPVSNVIFFSKSDNLSKIAIYKLYLEVEVLAWTSETGELEYSSTNSQVNADKVFTRFITLTFFKWSVYFGTLTCVT